MYFNKIFYFLFSIFILQYFYLNNIKQNIIKSFINLNKYYTIFSLIQLLYIYMICSNLIKLLNYKWFGVDSKTLLCVYFIFYFIIFYVLIINKFIQFNFLNKILFMFFLNFFLFNFENLYFLFLVFELISLFFFIFFFFEYRNKNSIFILILFFSINVVFTLILIFYMVNMTTMFGTLDLYLLTYLFKKSSTLWCYILLLIILFKSGLLPFFFYKIYIYRYLNLNKLFFYFYIFFFYLFCFFIFLLLILKIKNAYFYLIYFFLSIFFFNYNNLSLKDLFIFSTIIFSCYVIILI